MKIKMTNNKISLILLNIIVTVLELFFISTSSYSLDFLPTLSIMVLFNFFIQLVTMRILNMPYKSFFFLFICLLYVFHFGQVFCTALLDEDPSGVTNMLKTVLIEGEYVIKLFVIIIGTINSFFIGGVFQSSTTDNYIDTYHTEEDKKIDRTCFLLGITLFLISTPLRLYVDIQQLTAAFLGGYFSAIEVTVSGVVSCIAGFWYIAVLFLSISIQDNTKRKVFISICMLYMLLSMFTGNRGHQLVNILAIVLVLSYLKNEKVHLRKIIKLVIIGFMGLIVINLIFRMRIYGISYMFSNFEALLQETINNNVVSQTLYELGGTIKTPYLVVKGLGSKLNPFFGETFFRSLLVCIPDVTGLLSENTNMAILGRVLNKAYNISALGGSFIGEIYYSFQQLYFVVSFLFGCIYYKISANIIFAIKSKENWYVCKYLPFLVYSLWWVRDSFCGMLRPVIWIAIIYIVVRRVVSNKQAS